MYILETLARTVSFRSTIVRGGSYNSRDIAHFLYRVVRDRMRTYFKADLAWPTPTIGIRRGQHRSDFTRWTETTRQPDISRVRVDAYRSLLRSFSSVASRSRKVVRWSCPCTTMRLPGCKISPITFNRNHFEHRKTDPGIGHFGRQLISKGSSVIPIARERGTIWLINS